MLVGSTIRKMGGAVFHSPEFPRGGLAALFSLDATGEIGGTTMFVHIEHRNRNETSWTNVGLSSMSITATGVQTLDLTDLKEVLRWRFSFSGGSDGDGFHVALAPPAWRPLA